MAMKRYNEFVMRLRRGEPLAAPAGFLPVRPLGYRFDGDRLSVKWQGADGRVGVLDTEFDYTVAFRFLEPWQQPGGNGFQECLDVGLLVDPTHWTLELLLREIGRYDFGYVTPFAFSDPFTDMLEVVVKNANLDWAFLHPWADYQVQEIWPQWPEEVRRRELEADPDFDDAEHMREFNLHRMHFSLLEKSLRREMPLEEVVSWMADSLGIRPFLEKPLYLYMNENGFACFSEHLMEGR
ncbi:MAG: hypothetical protein H7833_06280 [Magnetococcus sp. DMHC-1]